MASGFFVNLKELPLLGSRSIFMLLCRFGQYVLVALAGFCWSQFHIWLQDYCWDL